VESLVLTVIGPDRPGLVESLASTIAQHGASWLDSRMSRLAGQFAGILRVGVPDDRAAELYRALMELERGGLRVVVQSGARAEPAAPAKDTARRVKLDLLGADRPGIVQSVSGALAQRGVNVDELVTECVDAPMSGELLFKATAHLAVPADVDLASLRARIEAIAADLMVDISLEETPPPKR
jgi:glycine cleavage system regulatory protein